MSIDEDKAGRDRLFSLTDEFNEASRRDLINSDPAYNEHFNSLTTLIDQAVVLAAAGMFRPDIDDVENDAMTMILLSAIQAVVLHRFDDLAVERLRCALDTSCERPSDDWFDNVEPENDLPI